MNRITALLAAFVLTLTCFASASEEAGKYDRSSISYIDALWLLDGSTRNMSGAQVGQILDATKKEIMMKRFDYNPLPSYIKARFVAEANRSLSNFAGDDDAALKAVTKVMNKTVVPEVVKILDATKELRAQKMLTEEQKNSFITDKAKELGITAAELKKVMNSAYIFIPLAKNYVQTTNGDSYTEKISLGIIWWRISTEGGSAKATVATQDFTKTMGMATVGASYGAGGHKAYAFNSMVKNGARNLKVATQEIPEFKLSGQVLSGNGMKATFDLGKEEGIRVDDKYYIMKNTMDGKQKKAGWIIVKKVGDSTGSMGYQSKGQVISGKPMIGSVVQEFPRLPIDITLGYKLVNYDINQSKDDGYGEYIDSINISTVNVLTAGASYNFGRHLKVSQLWFDFNYGFGFGDAAGSIRNWNKALTSDSAYADAEKVQNVSFEFGLTKKFYMRRMGIDLQAGFITQTMRIKTVELGLIALGIENESIGGYVRGGLSFAVSPRVSIGVKGGYQIMGKSDEWTLAARDGAKWEPSDTKVTDTEEIDHSGFTISAGFTYSPRALPFDPLAALGALRKK